MRYVDSQYKKRDREEAYRIYVTDALKLIGHLNLRYADVMNKKVKNYTEESAKQEAEETKARIFGKLRKMSEEG